MNKALITLSFLVVLTACGGDGGSEDGTGKLSIAVTDAPVDHAEAVVVGFTGIDLYRDGEPAVSFNFVVPEQVDLLALQGDNSYFLIQNVEIPVGVYSEVRLRTANDNANCNGIATPYASYVTVDSVDYPLIVPSGGSSGLKVQGPITVAAGGSAAYTIDFDLRKSLAERGATGCYNLKPVLRVVDNAQVGSLSGTVDAALLADSACTGNPVTGEGAAVYVFEGADATLDDVDGTEPEPLTSALLAPDGNGHFEYTVGFLLQGTYTVALTCQAGDDDPETNDVIAFSAPVDVAIQAEQTTQLDFVP
jgi:hypothetical protein